MEVINVTTNVPYTKNDSVIIDCEIYTDNGNIYNGEISVLNLGSLVYSDVMFVLSNITNSEEMNGQEITLEVLVELVQDYISDLG